ncbi:ribose-5-phosphate isomerase RpiA [Pajaroellobacter abortibovis]|uniref:Ribose 5-phosphate isomerase A n=1 Tax=Pajaroellobacter abortibovis TaxID=1882918 RepID=A0A1L6MX11_9BACT|nr:ribose-5-phosphate isomerase RpiA [Pajaroellobacter abortibovis]APS00091.1 ribose 5-phosphate isomerase A [Pajaroellobacter abortibovis]
MTHQETKRAVALAALKELPKEGTIGLGSGSTAALFIEALGQLIQQGRSFVGVPTSQASRELAEKFKIPTLPDSGPWNIAVTVDSADEVSQTCHSMIKGGGGAHTREKIVYTASQRTIIIIEERKLSPHLGEKASVPVEVLTFGHAQTAERLRMFGKVTLRMKDGAPWLTDSNHLIYDVSIKKIINPAALDRALSNISGVVETGLFCKKPDMLLIGRGSEVKRLFTPPSFK